MKFFSIHIIFLISAILFYSYNYASPATDSLPYCILKMKQKDSFLIIQKYDYKGQQWFGIRKMLTEEEKKRVNYINTVIFYNIGCNPVATWRTGGNGIIKVDKILPDTIDKTKIVKIIEKAPENIIQLAIKNNAASITEYEYMGQTLYFLNKWKDRNEPKVMIVLEPYYDKNGIEIIRFQRANNPAFFRAQQWVPYTVKPEKLIEKGVIWHNPSATQTK